MSMDHVCRWTCNLCRESEDTAAESLPRRWLVIEVTTDPDHMEPTEAHVCHTCREKIELALGRISTLTNDEGMKIWKELKRLIAERDAKRAKRDAAKGGAA